MTTRSAVQIFFLGALLYYFALLFAYSVAIANPDTFYLLQIAPIVLFAAAASVLAVPAVGRITPPTLFIAAYAIVAAVISAGRLDGPSIAHLIGFALPIFALTVFRITAPLLLLNVLFLAAIPIGAVIFVSGVGFHSPIPGFSPELALPWRISLFPLVPESAYFSGIVLLANFCYRLPLRFVVIPLAACFLVFSYQRAALIACMMGITYIVLAYWFQSKTMRWLIFAGMVGSFVALLTATQLLMLFSDNANGLVNEFVFRSADGIDNPEELQRTIYRTWIWAQHLLLFLSSPFVGVGTFDFAALAFDQPDSQLVTGSESFLTGLFARFGLVTLLFIAFMLAQTHRAISESRHYAVAVMLVTCVAMFAYGSFINTYNFMYLVLLVSAQRNAWDERTVFKPGSVHAARMFHGKQLRIAE